MTHYNLCGDRRYFVAQRDDGQSTSLSQKLELCRPLKEKEL